MLLIVKFFTSSNLAIRQLRNPHLIAILNHGGVPVKSEAHFRYQVLPEVRETLRKLLEGILQFAFTVCHVFDVLTLNGASYLAIISYTATRDWDMAMPTIGMLKMPSSQTAEVIAEGLERITNDFVFNKAKIHCKYNISMY